MLTSKQVDELTSKLPFKTRTDKLTCQLVSLLAC